MSSRSLIRKIQSFRNRIQESLPELPIHVTNSLFRSSSRDFVKRTYPSKSSDKDDKTPK